MRCSISLCLLFTSLTQIAYAAPRHRVYPTIRPARISVATDPSNPNAASKLIVKDSHGKPAYILWIVAASLDKHTTDSIELSLETTGKYASDPEGKVEPNLLNPDYWGHGTGRWVIHPDEVCVANQDNPVVGARRVFEFRRMRIVASVSDVELSPDFCPDDECREQVGGFKRMHLTVTVEPSASTRRRPAGYDELGWQYLKLKKCG